MNVSHTADDELLYTTPGGVLYLASGPDANCTYDACPIVLSTYGYRASLPLSGVCIALYGLCIVVQSYLGWRCKTWSYLTAMVLGCVSEIVGYIGRVLMWQSPWNRGGFTIQIVLITIGPVFFSAAIYVMLYQIVVYISVPAARFPPKLFYWIFIPCDIVSLVLQAAGGAMSSSSSGKPEAGVNIALAGLAFQVITLVAFLVAVADYAFVSRCHWYGKKLSGRFINFSIFLFLAVILILIRCSSRVYELSEGYSRESEALRDQPLFIGLEAIMVLLAAWCLVLSHPGPAFGSKHTRSGEKERTPMQTMDAWRRYNP